MLLTMLKLMVALALLGLVTGTQCPNQQLCGDKHTCCQVLSSGEYNCCPFPQGECCEDHLHCCPAGMLCQTAESKCQNSTHSLSWTERKPAQAYLAKSFRMISSSTANKDNIICPDNSSCPPEFSCLKLTDKYGCCPVTQGIVCADRNHCCPNDHECSADSISCVKKAEPVMCPDGVSECPVQTTCCPTTDGGWGCCPMPRAVCCADKVHCCPENSVCHVNSSKCVSSTNKELPMWAKFPARLRADWENHRPVAVTPKLTNKQPKTSTALKSTTTNKTRNATVSTVYNVPCDDTVACADGTTCCKNGEGGWSCCPLPQAVCCDDFIHCCPHGKKCNLAAGTCEDPSGSVPWMKKLPSQPIKGKKLPETKVYNVPCNDTAACPDETTCCKDSEGEWKCCPLPQAVCCDDFIHCCPHGKKCNLAAGTCEDPSGSVPWMKKLPSQPIKGKKLPETKGSDVPCNDTVACPDETTCCKNGKGGWNCCPLPQAVCCDDFQHCCPHGKKCNVAAGTCEDLSGSVPWIKKVPSRPIGGKKLPKVKGADVPCNATFACEDETTCCKNDKGGWSCCPLPEAVCCEDFLHCCPHGKKCNLAAMTCDDPSGSIPWLEKKPSRPIGGQNKEKGKAAAANVSCDSSHFCPASSTCCKDVNAEWSCCPFPQGVCCEDRIHCCPHDATCNLRTLTCDKNTTSVPMAGPVKASGPPPPEKKKPKENKANEPVKCDDHHSCPDQTTCCFMNKTMRWGCCPLPKAVCCEDGEHCCPAQYKCDKTQTSCIKGDVVIPWYNKLAAESSPDHSVDQSAVKCDSQTSCPAGTTCCEISTGKWGCCPLPEATCCPDREHCCPKGYSCDVNSQSCVKTILLQVETIPLTYIRHLQIPCGGGISCSDTETCCKTSKTTWGCCPSPKAVCCSDMKHCCPAGYTCEANGSCTQATGFNWDNWSVFFSRKKRALLV
ncbi:granulin a isoform X5 [Astyanax mexicanus]|uniref:granulin a isoform X5 n=1 Tax=Astyanax mexicanus TaxID=7994 RepID=UPI0020CB2CF1|nr:granulin a isoform X5 [Astyanax mexicanus]